MTATRPRMNPRAEKSTLLGGAGKGGGGLFRTEGALSMIRERGEREWVRFWSFSFEFGEVGKKNNVFLCL